MVAVSSWSSAWSPLSRLAQAHSRANVRSSSSYASGIGTVPSECSPSIDAEAAGRGGFLLDDAGSPALGHRVPIGERGVDASSPDLQQLMQRSLLRC